MRCKIGMAIVSLVIAHFNGLIIQSRANGSEMSSFLTSSSVAEIKQNLGYSKYYTKLPAYYEKLFPYYFKFCAGTRWDPVVNDEGKEGGPGGHGVIYLKGVHLNQNLSDATLSRLQMYPEDSDLSDPEKGVGISIDHYKNIPFIFIPTLKYVMAGDIGEHETLTEAKRQEMLDTVINLHFYENIELMEKVYNKYMKADEDWVRFTANYALGTDFAATMSRTMYCVNIPLSREMMSDVVDDVNKRRDDLLTSSGTPYRGIFAPGLKPDDDYHWSMLYDNCSSLANQLMAKFGIIPFRGTNLPLYQQLIGNVTSPANVFQKAFAGTNASTMDVHKIYADPEKRETFLKYNWVANAPGRLVEKIDIHQPNEVFNSNMTMLYYPNFIKLKLGSDLAEEVSKKSGFLLPNLQNFKTLYVKEIGHTKSEKEVALNREVQDSNYISFISRYEKYLQEKLSEVTLLASKIEMAQKE